MAIRQNLFDGGAIGTRTRGDDGGAIGRVQTMAINPTLLGSLSNIPDLVATPTPQPVPAVANGGTISPDVLVPLPDVIQPLPPIRPLPFPFPLPTPQPMPQSRTTTQLARGAIDQLNSANPALVDEARQTIDNTLRGQNLSNNGIMDYLERRVRVGEVLNNLAKDWLDTTKADFAAAFSMQADKLDVMDNIVSLAILNDRDLEAELRAENTPQATPGDLLQNRRVVWQYPDPGTVLTPPYLILIAVEATDTAAAGEVVQGIIGQLDSFKGFKLPRSVIAKLPR